MVRRDRQCVDGHEWCDENGWHYQPPRLDPEAELLTLALLEDLSKLLVIHGYPPLRGYALAEITSTLVRLRCHG
ncbi:MAG: hypothetical protein QOD70_2429 [Frankiales bacterium]|jgi:hypothetical protein|nr:hypothetical protein [Frankiales bacterium]